MAVEAGIGPVTAEDWSRAITLPQFSGGRDFLVAERDGRVVGLGESSRRGHDGRRVRHLKLVVDPTFRRIGIATALLCAVLAQDRDDAPVAVQGNAPSHWTAGLAFLQRYGFACVQSEIKMRCETPLPVFPVPAGIEVARAAPSAVGTARLADLHNAAFRDDAGFSRQTPDDAARQVEDGHLWVARLAGDVVGYALVDTEPALIWLETVAVDPALQGRGIGTALIAEALRGEGVGAGRAGGLSVSSVNGAAVRIYGRLGFESRSEVGKYAAVRTDLLARIPAAS